MIHVLKNNYQTTDKRLDRIPQFDTRSRKFALDAPAKKHRSYTHRCMTVLNQGSEGSCVGHGIAHSLIARPAEVQGIDHKFAKEVIYWTAQMTDPWEGGSYPGASPFYEGTSVLAGIKVAHALGYFDSYKWGFSLNDMIMGVGYHSPAIVGTLWYEGMRDTDHNGFIHATGKSIGGHCYLIRGVNVSGKAFLLRNSWGTGWGMGGDAWISFDDMEKLINNGGEQCYPLHAHVLPQPVTW